MIEFLSSWVKGLGLAIIIVSILEMLLPDNKTKKYIRMVMGVYILFTIIAPFIQNKEILSVSNIDFEKYVENNQNSKNSKNDKMETRIKELYIQELEKDITKKIEEKGYKVVTCLVEASTNEITKIRLNIQKAKQEENNKNSETFENAIVVRNSKNKTS